MSIIVDTYDARWPITFEDLRRQIWPAVADRATAIEHVGSTAVPGLAAKPVIDMTIVARTADDVPVAIERLTALGYEHRGNLGVEGRETFRAPASLPRHHLYLCPPGALALRNHLLVRDYLRTHPDAVREYGALKRRLATEHADDIDGYTEGKTDFILAILRAAGLSDEDLAVVEGINKATGSARAGEAGRAGGA